MGSDASSTATKPGALLPDQRDRDLFTGRLDRNYSVIAPAGVGKTTAIVGRMATLARRFRSAPAVPMASPSGASTPPHGQLVLVTYARKAAEEMRQRTHRALRESSGPLPHRDALDGTFFGTIHSFCLDLVRRFGGRLGWPSQVEMVETSQLEPLWLTFLRQHDRLLADFPEATHADLRRWLPIAEVVALAQSLPITLSPLKLALSPAPPLRLNEVLGYVPANGRLRRGVGSHQIALADWQHRHQQREDFLDLPDYSGKDDDYRSLIEEAFREVEQWRSGAATLLTSHYGQLFGQFRLNQGQVTYDDMVELAAHLVAQPKIAPQLQQLGYRVIVDEAQDTTRQMFRVLLSCAMPRGFKGDPFTAIDQLEPGRFCMVGDPQQAIYERADLPAYLQLHEALAGSPHGDALQFTVTMRCPQAVVAAANALFPEILNRRDNDHRPGSQVAYVPLSAREEAPLGRVEAWVVPADLNDSVPIDPGQPDRPGDGAAFTPTHPPSRTFSNQAAPPKGKAGDSISLKRAGVSSKMRGKSPPDASPERTDSSENVKTPELAVREGAVIAERLTELGTAGLGIADWRELAILLPRKEEIPKVAAALAADGIDSQAHSGQASLLENPACAWFLACLTVLAHPSDAWEISGLLREAGGLTDGEIARWRGLPGSIPRPLTIAVPPQIDQNSPTADADARVVEELAALHSLWRSTQGCPLLVVGRAILDQWGLTARLAALQPQFPDTDFGEKLRYLLEELLLADKAQLTLAEAAQELKRRAESAKREAPARPGAVQLLTYHKAKGLEWPAVILAGLFRSLNPGTGGAYPRWEPGFANQPPNVVLQKSEERRHDLKHLRFQGHQRLFYVGFTRAKQRLILLDHAHGGGERDGSLADAAGWFFGSPNFAWWEQLKTGVFEETPQPAASRGVAVEGRNLPTPPGVPPPSQPPPLPRWSDVGLPPTLPVPRLGPRRVLPSSLATHEPPRRHPAVTAQRSIDAQPDPERTDFSAETEIDPETEGVPPGLDLDGAASEGPPPLPESAALPAEDNQPVLSLDNFPPFGLGPTNYGNWWHHQMETAPFSRGLDTLNSHLQAGLSSCPAPERGRSEVAAFLDSPLAARLAEPGSLVSTEVPFLWHDPNQRVLDGFIDCLARWQAGGTAIIDWKTDRLPLADLIDRYTPQVRVYATAVASLLQRPVTAMLYSTTHATANVLSTEEP